MEFLAPWHKIKKVKIDLGKNVIVSFSGHGSYTLCFEKKDCEKLISTLKQYLPPEVFRGINETEKDSTEQGERK